MLGGVAHGIKNIMMDEARYRGTSNERRNSRERSKRGNSTIREEFFCFLVKEEGAKNSKRKRGTVLQLLEVGGGEKGEGTVVIISGNGSLEVLAP